MNAGSPNAAPSSTQRVRHRRYRQHRRRFRRSRGHQRGRRFGPRTDASRRFGDVVAAAPPVDFLLRRGGPPHRRRRLRRGNREGRSAVDRIHFAQGCPPTLPLRRRPVADAFAPHANPDAADCDPGPLGRRFRRSLRRQRMRTRGPVKHPARAQGLRVRCRATWASVFLPSTPRPGGVRSPVAVSRENARKRPGLVVAPGWATTGGVEVASRTVLVERPTLVRSHNVGSRTVLVELPTLVSSHNVASKTVLVERPTLVRSRNTAAINLVAIDRRSKTMDRKIVRR